MQAVWKQKRVLLTRDPRQRRIGRPALPYMIVFQIVLPIIAPLVDLFALYEGMESRESPAKRV